MKWVGKEPRYWAALQIALSSRSKSVKIKELERLGAIYMYSDNSTVNNITRNIQIKRWMEIGNIVPDEHTRAIIQVNVMAEDGEIAMSPTMHKEEDYDDVLDRGTIKIGNGNDIKSYNIVSNDGDHVKAFGIRKSEAVTSGLVIVDGNVLMRPYIVTRYGLQIRINDIDVTEIIKWPIVDHTKVEKDPGLPPPDLPGIPPDRTSDANIKIDAAWLDYWINKYYWLRKEHGSDKAVAIWANVLKKHPDIKSIEIDSINNGFVSIVDVHNNVLNLSLNDPRKEHFIDRAHEIDELYDKYSSAISNDSVVIINNKKPLLMGRENKNWAVIKLLINNKELNYSFAEFRPPSGRALYGA
jgi:hypothetical protein